MLPGQRWRCRLPALPGSGDPGAAGFVRIRDFLLELGFDLRFERLRVVVNRYAAGDGNLPPGTVAERLGRPVDYTVSYNRAFAVAANRGTPMILGRLKGDFAEVVGRIAEDAVRPVLSRPT